jgi:hypothetical protein
MRARSMVGLLAFVLAVAVISAGTAVAQTPVVPATTGPPPKAEKPKAAKPKAEEPKAEKPKPEEPKPEEPKAEEPKAEEPKAEEPKAEEPKAEKPKAEEPKAEEPTAEKPAVIPKRPRPAQPKRIHANTPRAQPNEPAPKPQVEVATTVSPGPTTAPPLAASGATDASPQPLGRSGADATPVASRTVAVVPRREPRVASDELTEAAAVPIDRQPGRLLPLDSLPAYNVAPLLLTVFLAVAFAIGLGYHIRRDLRGSPSTAPLRRQPPVRALRRRPTLHAFSGRVCSSIAAWSAGISTAPGRSPTRRTPSFESGSRIRPGAMRPHGGRRSTSTARGRTTLAAQRPLWRSPGSGRSR